MSLEIIKIDFIFSSQVYSEEISNSCHSLDLLYFPTPWSHDSWKSLFVHSQRVLAVAKSTDDDQLVGFALFDINAVDSFAHLLKILIIPKRQNKGEGLILMRTSLDFLLKDKKIHQFFLEVERENSSAIRMYEKSGFNIIHTKKHFYGTNKDALIMTLKSCVS